MKKNFTAITVLVLLSVLLSACNLSAANPTQIGPDQINTIAAQTVEALTTQMAPPPATATNTPEPATATPLVTVAPTLAIPTLNLTPGALTNTLIPLPTSAGTTECNKVFFLSDVNIPDGTTVKTNAEFTKTWKIQNSGSCTWTTLYSAAPFSNDPASPVITGDGEFPVKANVAPGGILEVTVKMFAPKEEGTYTQTWKMQDDQGNFFGIGGPNGAGWYVNIKVTKTGATSTTVKYNTTAEGVCSGGTATLDGTIGLSAAPSSADTPNYFYIVDGSSSLKSATFSDLSFNSTGSKTATTGTVSGLGSGNHTVQLYISSSPIAMGSTPAGSFNCPE